MIEASLIANPQPSLLTYHLLLQMINEFIDWAQQQANGRMCNVADILNLPSLTNSCSLAVWIVNSRQLLDWVRNPVPVSQLNNITSFQCALPVVTEKICNGMPANEAGLLSSCPFSEFPFFTCVRVMASSFIDLSRAHFSAWTGSTAAQLLHRLLLIRIPVNPRYPVSYGHDVSNLLVQQSSSSLNVFHRSVLVIQVPSDCQTAFWDPIGAKCLCQNGTSCQFQDQTRPIGVSTSCSH
jgi:hypothetical protein